MFENIIKSILISLYQETGAALLVTVLTSFVYLYVRKFGIKTVFREWWSNLRENRDFLKFLIFVFFLFMVLFRTILCREIWSTVLQDVIGIWGLHDAAGNLYTEGLENILLFIPLGALVFWVFSKQIFKGSQPKLNDVVIKSIIFGFIFSLGIELTQLFLKCGTFQLSDLFYNTLGNLIGGFIFWICHFIKVRAS